jgi:error-prone DNA polymerase
MAAVLTNQGGYYTPMEYAEEARRCGVQLQAPCVQESLEEFWGRERCIRVGLMQVKGLSDVSIAALLRSRTEHGPFRDLEDFLCRVPVSHPEAESLVRCGAMASFGSQPRLLWELALRWRAARAATDEPGSRKTLSWAAAATPRVQQLLGKVPALAPYDAPARMQAELEILEITLEAHPFALFDELLTWVRTQRPIVASCDLARHVGKDVYLLGWKVTSKQTRTVNDESMCFVTFSDPRGRFEVSFFPEVYEQYAPELYRGYGPYLIKGAVEASFGVAEVVGRHLKLLSPKAVPSRAAVLHTVASHVAVDSLGQMVGAREQVRGTDDHS